MSSASAEFEGFLEDLRVYFPNALTQRDFLLCIESQERELADLKAAAKALVAQKSDSGVKAAYARLTGACK